MSKEGMLYNNTMTLYRNRCLCIARRLQILYRPVGVLLLAAGLSACVSLPTSEQVDGIAIGSERFQQLEDDFYLLAYRVVVNEENRYPNLDTIIDQYRRFYDQIAAAGIVDEASAEYLYFDALVNKEIMRAALRSDDIALARQYYKAALSSARKVARKSTAFPNAYALLASLLYQPYNAIGGRSGLLTTTLTGKVIAQAMGTEARNPGAWETQGMRYLYLPIGFGGDRNLAINAFRIQSEDAHPYHRFFGRAWLALAYYVEERQEEAVATLDEIRQEIRYSPYWTAFADTIKSGKRPF